MSPKAAYATLLTKPTYLPGTLVLHHGLRAAKSKYPLVAMVPLSLPQDARTVLEKSGVLIREIQSLYPKEGSHALAPQDERFRDTWMKLRVFELVEYDRVVLLDCDMIIRKNIDELMLLELKNDHIAAAHVCACNPRKLSHYPPDWIPANCAHSAVTHPLGLPPPASDSAPRPYHQLNSGTVVLNPSIATAEAIVQYLTTSNEVANFLFPDQDLLSAFFKGRWKPLPWYYNALKTLRYVHPNLWADDEVRCLHYILPDKPWLSRSTPAEFEDTLGQSNRWWWAQFDQLERELKFKDPEGWRLVAAHVAAPEPRELRDVVLLP